MPAWFEVAAAAAVPEVAAISATEVALADIAAQQAAAAAMSSAGIGALGGLAGASAPGLGGLAGYEAFLEQLTALNPEIVAQNQAIAQAAAVPPSGPIAGQISAATPPVTEGIGNLPAGSNFAQPIPAQYQTAMNQLAQGTGQYPGTQLASTTNAVPGALGGGAPTSELAQAAAKYPDLYPGGTMSSGSTVFNPSGTAQYSFSGAPETVSTLQARGATAPVDAATKGISTAAQTPAKYGNFMNEVEPGWASSTGAPEVAKPGFTNPISQFYNWYKEQDAPVRYGIGALGTMQAAKFLNKQPSVAGAPEYNGPLSKIRMSPNYTPYSYRPYAAGGPVEQMSNENAIGANTGYPQADIHQGAYATPWQTPVSRNVVADSGDIGVDQMTGLERMARGGIAHFEGGGEASGGGDAGGAAAAGAPGAGDTGGLASLAYSPSMYSSSLYAPDMVSPSMYSPMMYSPSMMSTSLVDPAAAYAAAQPTMDMSRQNFQNFISGYQNMPGLSREEINTLSAKNLAKQEADRQAAVAATSINEPRPAYEDTPSYWLNFGAAAGGLMASGGISDLGSYSDGGRLLKGPGDGMSDNIPASISGKQPARLADGEFVVPADVVSGLGNGSTDAGAKHLYSMMDKVRAARTGTKKQGKQINPRKYLPA